MKKRILSLLLAALMVFSLFPVTAFATGTSYAITNGSPESAKETNHGYIAIDKATAAEGETVTITVNPADGYQLKSLTVTPVAPTEYIVTFDLNGITGTAPTSQTIKDGEKVTKPADPTDTIHTFAGWYKTKDATTGALSDPWDFDNDTVTADMTLYAQWTRTLESIYTNSDIPKVTGNTAPDDAWENGDGGKAFIAYSTGNTVLYLYKQLQPSGAKQLSCRKTENFTKIGDDYVLDYYLSSSFYGKYTLHMTDGKFTSVTYDGTGTDYEELSGTYSPVSQCIAAGTMISMPGGKQKAVEELEIGDVICTFDHETGEVSSAPVCFIWESKNAGNAFTLTFEDDVEVTVIEEHGFYDQEEQKYVFINLQNAEEYIGDHFYNADTNSWLALKNCEALNESIDAYAIITSGDLNHMSNGMLSMCDGTVKVLANIFEYDNQMKFDADRKKADIEAYGLTPKEKILELEGFIESDYDDYNLQYLNVAIGKGLTTWEWIEAFSDYCVENGLVDIYSGSETAEKNEAPKMLLMSATAPKTLLGSTPEPTPQDGIEIKANENGTYQFTMPAKAVTVTAEFEEKAITIADILPDDFPTCVDVLPPNLWVNGNEVNMMVIPYSLVIFTLDGDGNPDYVELANDIRTATLTKNGNNYTYTNSGVTTTFLMSDNGLESVKIEGLTGEYVDFNGTYGEQHAHSFTYTVNGGKLTATCTQGCDKGYDTTPLTLTLTAPASLVYDGNVKAFTFADGEAAAWTGAGLELPTITYYQKNSGQGWYTQLNEVPVNAGGDYMAEIVVNNKAAQVKFTIDKATPYIKTNPEPTDIVYGKKLADSTLAGGYVQVSSTNTTQVGGLFEWTNPDTVPDLDDSEVTEYDVTFTPADTNNFNTVSCKVKIEVNHTHAPVLVNGQAATESAAGWKDYYECACGALFEDENGTTPIENLATWKAQGGNGYIAPLPTHSSGGDSTPIVTVPVTGNENSVKVSTTVSGSTATIKDIKDADLAKVTGGESVEIDLTGLKKNIETAKIPTATVEKIGEQAGMSVKLTTATVAFDKTATQEISDQAKGNTVELVVDDIKEVSLNAVQKEAVQKLDTALIIDAYLVSGGTKLCTEGKGGFNGGKATVMLPYEIKNNRSAANYNVFYVDDTGKLEKLAAKYDVKLGAFVFDITHFSNYVVAYDENACLQDATCVYAKFIDADTKAWYHDGVHFCVENGYMQGVSATAFDPSGTTTRAMIVTMLWRMEGEPVVNYAMSFKDVSADQWYAEAIRWAQSTGVVDGYSADAFGPSDDVTREQLAAILYNYAKLKGQGFTGSWMFLLDFVDRADISSWADEAVHWCSMKGIVNGKDGKVFDPQGNATRAEAAAMLQRFCETILSK